MKNCPYCAELVQDEAKKCKHCGEWFENKAQTLFKKAKSFINEQELRRQAKIEANRKHSIKIRIGQLLNYIDYLEAEGYLIFVLYDSQDELFSIVHGLGAGRANIDIQIINRDTIKIDNFGSFDYDGHIGILESLNLGNSMSVVLNDLYNRKNGTQVTPKF
tara:strand:- start:13691 stop:14173 length:483 start_codon:yes stop_codon:yes gene_type:complete